MRLSVTAGSGTAGAESAVAGPRPVVARRWLYVAIWAIGCVAAFACYLRLARTQPLDSDAAAQALGAWDMLHGNLLLHGWFVADVPLYTIDLPVTMLAEVVRGLTPDALHVGAAVTYVLLVLLAALLAKGTATGRAALVRVLVAVGIMVAPQLGAIGFLINRPDHLGPTVPVLVAWLILDRARPRWWVPAAVAVLLVLALVDDPLVLVTGVLPLAIVCLVRVFRAAAVQRQKLRDQWYDLALGAGGVVAYGVSRLVLRLIADAGGFSFQPATWAHLIPPAGLRYNVKVTVQGLLQLFGADFSGLRPGADVEIAALHLVGVALAALAVLVAAFQFLRGRDRVTQVLVAGIAFNLAAYVGTTVPISANAREIAPVVPLAAALAGRVLADRIRVSQVALAALSVVFLGLLAGLGYELTTPPAQPQNQPLAAWLQAHHFRSGLAGYWAGTVINLTTGDRVQVAPVISSRGKLGPFEVESKRSWYDPRQSSANFVILDPRDVKRGFINMNESIATFGPPAHVYHVGSDEVLAYNKNLLPDLGPGIDFL